MTSRRAADSAPTGSQRNNAMNEADDRLAGDPVWELFPHPSAATPGSSRIRDVRTWLAVACVVAALWYFSPAVAVVAACLAVAARDFRTGWRLARSIPDKAGGTICARFTYGWGAYKIGMTAFGLLFVTSGIAIGTSKPRVLPPGIVAAMLLWFGGFLASAVLTGLGLLGAYRAEMRVWIGEGVNQARLLLLSMLIVMFTFVVLGPFCLGIASLPEGTAHEPGKGSPLMGILLGMLIMGVMFVGPVTILVILDWLSRRVVADHPAKFGPKVPTVGKWNT